MTQIPELAVHTRTVAAGLGFLEGPVLLPGGDIAVVRGTDVLRVSDDGGVERLAHCGGNPNGLALSPDGSLLVANNGGVGRPDKVPGSIQRVSPDGAVVDLAGNLDAPNDICVDAAGTVWFTDPRDSWFAESPRPGRVYRLDGATATIIHSGLWFPNGIGLHPAGGLVVAESRTGALHHLAASKPPYIWARCPYGAPDGLAITPDGWCFVCAFDARTIWLFDPHGTVVGRIDTGAESMPTNCALRPDGSLVVTEAQQGRILVLTLEEAACVT
jgi:gluconolactonase